MSRKRQKLDRRPLSEADLQRGTRQLRRIETLIDCVYALVIVLTVSELPLPADEGLTAVSAIEFMRTHVDAYLPVLIAIVLVVLYWIQNNILFGNLSRTDDRHSAISLLQIFFLLFYFYTIGLGLDLDNPPSALALQSVTVVLVGLCSLAGWSYASRNRRLLAPEVSVEKIRKVFEWSREIGLERRAFFLIGMPNETVTDIHLTEKLISEIDPDVFGVTILCPYPGSDFYDPETMKYYDWSVADEYSNPYWKTRHLSNQDLRYW